MINIDEKQKNVLQILVESDDFVSLADFQKMLEVSKRTVYYLINKINETLSIYAINPIKNKRGSGYYLEKEQKEKISNLFTDSLVESSLKSEDRVHYLICWLLYPDDVIHVDTIMDRLDVSRNSVFSDLKKVKSEIEKYHLDIVYTGKEGYRIKGELSNYHTIFLHYITQVLRKISYKELFFLNTAEFKL